MKKIFYLLLLVGITSLLSSCSQNYSNGERIGFITKFSQKGLFWKSWECEINLTQTGMNTSSTFPCSIDNDTKGNENYDKLVATLDSAAINGWKIKIRYHQVKGWNWFDNRGHTSYFITDCIVLDKNMVNNINNITHPNQQNSGKVVDTVYVVIVDPNRIKK